METNPTRVDEGTYFGKIKQKYSKKNVKEIFQENSSHANSGGFHQNIYIHTR